MPCGSPEGAALRKPNQGGIADGEEENMTRGQAEARKTAIRAVRSQARRLGIDPATLDDRQALAVLDDIARAEPALVASEWYLNATESQIKQFVREWNRWKRSLIPGNSGRGL